MCESNSKSCVNEVSLTQQIWRNHRSSGVSEEDVQELVGIGIDEAKARACLEKCGGNIDAAMDAAFS